MTKRWNTRTSAVAKSRHGAPEHSTQNMPLIIIRCSAHGRPARGVAGSAGNKGWMRVHASSGRS